MRGPWLGDDANTLWLTEVVEILWEVVEKQARLTRTQVISRLRDHAAKYGFASTESLHAHDSIVLRSIPLYFPGLVAARHVAGVAGPPYRKPKRKTGPKPGTKSSQPKRTPAWSRKRVLDELRELHRRRQSTTWQDLISDGRAALIRAANDLIGGLVLARKAAGIPTPKRRGVAKNKWTKDMVIATLKARHRSGQPLAMSRVPPDLYNAARRDHGNWKAALAAAGIDASDVRVKKYTKQVVIDRLREAAKAGSELRSRSLARVLDLKAVNREFGTLEQAIRAAGLIERLRARRHGGAKWTRELLIEAIRERAARGVYTFTSRLHRVIQVYFGGAEEARAAAGTANPVDVRMEQRRRRANHARKTPRTRRE